MNSGREQKRKKDEQQRQQAEKQKEIEERETVTATVALQLSYQLSVITQMLQDLAVLSHPAAFIPQMVVVTQELTTLL